MKTHEIRQRFIDHYVDAGHTLVPSASLVLEDPTLLFVNAGMVPFKPYFLGQQTPPFSTATSIQKCVRTLDIDEVGITTRHNTFFQMAGNFSFGAYFKEGAIKHAWTLLTSPLDQGGYALPKDRIWVTVFEDDDEAFAIWRDVIGVDESHIQRRGMKDNYWSMGVPGPCGPSSEIFYDRGPEYGVEGGPVADEDRFIEIWNLVFMQNERGEGIGKDGYQVLGPLPRKNIDTGMGIERIAAILQGVENVYETDLLRPTITAVEKLTGARYSDDPSQATAAMHFRIIADHARTAVMLVTDGVVPSNEGRGYILRRLIRRTIRSARLLGATTLVMKDLVAKVRDAMAPSFPDIAANFDHIERVCVVEEQSFLRTLDAGTRLFVNAVSALQSQGVTEIPGDIAFTLHDTHGFPIDLTREMAAEKGLTVDEDGFRTLMAQQKQRAKADSQAKKHGHADLSVYKSFIDDCPTNYIGYKTLTSHSQIIGLLHEGELAGEVHSGDAVEVILDVTPFYAESGGQCADRGTIATETGEIVITDVQKVGKKVWLHRGRVSSGTVTPGFATATVDELYHRHAQQSHTATHLIHSALRSVLGETAVQAGSLNKPGYLRFDFNWSEPFSAAQMAEIERCVNKWIDDDLPVSSEEMSYSRAISEGAIALFGENYGESVRVVTIGGGDESRVVSKELCGGNHVTHTSQIGSVRIVSESSVGSGIRRIEAYVGLQAVDAARADRLLVNALTNDLKVKPGEVVGRVAQLSAHVKQLEKELTELRMQAVLNSASDLAKNADTIDGVNLVASRAPEGIEAAQLRTLVCDVRERLGSKPAIVVLFSVQGEKVPFAAAVNPAGVAAGWKAGEIIKQASTFIAGRGGGKPDLAQGAGSHSGGIDDAIAHIQAIVAGND